MLLIAVLTRTRLSLRGALLLWRLALEVGLLPIFWRRGLLLLPPLPMKLMELQLALRPQMQTMHYQYQRHHKRQDQPSSLF